jgi:protein-tyrosine phosphatase
MEGADLAMKIKVLFVCMGNICRSPAAQGVFERLLAEHGLEQLIEVDSAGTHAYHVGEAPDARMQAAAARRGLNLSGQRARRVAGEDFLEYRYILAMDYANLAELQQRMPDEGTQPALFMTYAGAIGVDEVPDPYYGGETGFERVLDLVEEAANGLLQSIRTQHSI